MTRRRLLLSTLAVPLLARGENRQLPVELIIEPHCLAEESGRGYQKLLAAYGNMRSSWIVLPAVRRMSPEIARNLRRRVEGGAWLVWESGLAYSPEPEIEAQRRILSAVFGLSVIGPVPEISPSEYVAYSRPSEALVRTFGPPLTLDCRPEEMIATYAGQTVACRKRMGLGGVFLLGSALGASLSFEDREAITVASRLFSRQTFES